MQLTWTHTIGIKVRREQKCSLQTCQWNDSDPKRPIQKEIPFRARGVVHAEPHSERCPCRHPFRLRLSSFGEMILFALHQGDAAETEVLLEEYDARPFQIKG